MKVATRILGRDLSYRPLTAITPDGLAIRIQDHDRGGSGREVLFIHGYCQSSLAWLKQVTGPLAERHRLVTYDLRGHGASDKPKDADYYREPGRWAAEVGAVIAVAKLDRPVIVCWSYGGRVALDYLRETGGAGIGGLVMVAATCTHDPAAAGDAAPLLRGMAEAEDLVRNIAATRGMLAACTARPLPDDEFALMLAYNLLATPNVRQAMIGRTADYDAVLAGLPCPLLTIHGAADRINRPAMSEHALGVARDARGIIYPGVGHLPFWEEAARFDADLDAFLSSTAFDDTAVASRQRRR